MNRRLLKMLAVLAVLGMLATACSGDGGETEDDGDTGVTDETEATTDDGTAAEEEPADEGTEAEGATEESASAEGGGSFTIYNCEPQFLNITDARDVCGGAVLRQLFSPLVENDAETGEPELFVAESVETEDNITWTITIGDQWTFHDGTPVTAQSYVDAWNTVAQPEASNNHFFSRFEGYQEVQDGTAETLSGAEVIDDTTIQVTLTEPFAPFLTTLADTSFYPLPQAYYDDPAAFENAPIGNGRYMMNGEWERGVQIPLIRYDDWPGEDPGQAEEITYVIYSDVQTAYLDVQAGNLDILDNVPPETLTQVESDFGDNIVRTETSSFTYLGFPMYDPAFGENQDLRRALSLAIDRQAIIDTIFNGTRIPATAVIPPVLSAHRTDACEFCEYDPEQAVELFEAAGGWDGTMTMYFNSGAGHEEWVQAIANQWGEVLGITDIQFESLEFAQYLTLLEEQDINGPYRLGWSLSYLSPEYAMSDLYTSTGGSNYFGYSNPEFDAALQEANATEVEEADAAYQAAEDILLEDFPLIPLWYEVRTTVHSDRVQDVVMDPSNYVRVEDVTVVE